MSRHLWISTAALCLLAGTAAAQPLDTYDPARGQLTIPTLSVGSATFTNVVVSVGLGNIVVAPSGSQPKGTVDTYDPASNHLTVQQVQVGAKTYYNVVVAPTGLLSAGGVTGTDTYDAPSGVLTIPAVQVGGLVYTNVKIHPGAILSQGGGLPHQTLDVYAGGELTIEAVVFQGRVFTNAIISAQSIVSIGGQLPGATTIYSYGGPQFTPQTGADTFNADYGLVQLNNGAIYGVGNSGGINAAGTFFQITPAGVETILYAFGNYPPLGDASKPAGPLLVGNDGNFYGVSANGGVHSVGTVYRITPTGSLTVLYSFSGYSAVNGGGAFGSTDGAVPHGALVEDSQGNFYGTTYNGGVNGIGAAFKLTPAGVATTLHSFGAGTDGSYPNGGLTLGKDGNLYGTTPSGGVYNQGTVFSISSSGAYALLYSFGAATGDGNKPDAGLTMASDGNLYGTTVYGGQFGYGSVFRVTPGGGTAVIYSFNFQAGGAEGASPDGGVIQATDGNLYGLTESGGLYGSGTLYRVTLSGAEQVLHAFSGQVPGGGNGVSGSIDLADPTSRLLQASDGSFYATSSSGGAFYKGAIVHLTGVLTAH